MLTRLQHYHGEDYCFCQYYYYYYYFLSFFANEVYRTNMTHIQVWTPSGPKYTDPLSATLTHFSRSQTHFVPKTENFKSI